MQDDQAPSSDHGPVSERVGRHLVYFAAERTLLVWISSSLGLMGLGFVVDRFGLALQHYLHTPPPPALLSHIPGPALVLLGASMSMTAAVRYARFAIDYHRSGEATPGYGIALGVVYASILSALGVLVALVLMMVTA